VVDARVEKPRKSSGRSVFRQALGNCELAPFDLNAAVNWADDKFCHALLKPSGMSKSLQWSVAPKQSGAQAANMFGLLVRNACIIKTILNQPED
jgi:hypothetical protein